MLHSAAVFVRIMSPALYNPSVRRREYASITILNAFTLAVACWCAAGLPFLIANLASSCARMAGSCQGLYSLAAGLRTNVDGRISF